MHVNTVTDHTVLSSTNNEKVK